MTHDDYLLVLKWRLIKLTHWTLDYVDSLSVGKIFELVQLEDGIQKAGGK